MNVVCLQALKNALEAREEQFPPTLCIIEARKLCLKYDNSIFNKRRFLQNDGTAQGPHMSCSYGDIAIEQFDKKHQNLILQLLVGKGFEMIFF